MKSNAGGGAIYGIGIFGALVYFLQHAHSFGAAIVGIVESFLWPGVLVYKALELLKL